MEYLGEDAFSSCLSCINTFFQESKVLVNLAFVWCQQLDYAYLIKEYHRHILLTVFLLTVCLVVFYKRNKSGKKPKVDECELNPIKLNWNVFDLAKSAYEPGHTEAVISLVEKYGYDVNYVMPSGGLSLFLCSCLSGDRKLIKYMISKGAVMNIHTRDGDSPIYLSTFGILNSPYVDPDVLTDLSQAGCCVNTQNLKGYTPLHRAAAKGNTDVIRHLLKLGADRYLPTKSGIYPMDSAINAGHLEAAELLKIKLENPHVWEVVDPHTPPRIKLGLQSPIRKHLIESSRVHRPFQNVFTF
ncbi:26S proteasome non-ATPase regulatory subunit 10-like [Mytilus trossulus]|uniref:26S proteasome non-ATPase regulatory subunit 10-like n=1 Tax=Mytilus trossulus TaxID=6551 RepID=UPI003004B425